MTMRADVIIIGAGGAGLMCAIEAGKRGRSVLVLDHADEVGKKIVVSGGGRCNFTNTHAAAENYLSQNPDFCKSALARFTPSDFIALVEKHRVPYHEKKLGQQFCDDTSRRIVELLLVEAAAAGVEILLNSKVGAVTKGAGFRLETTKGSYECVSLVIATGGLSFPKLGATDFGYRIARQFGMGLTEIRPALVPLTFSPDDLRAFRDLSGVSIPTVVRFRGQEFRENVLITHRGLSGPAILQISSYRREKEPIEIDLLPNLSADDWLIEQHSQKIELSALLSAHLPRRFAETWCREVAPSMPIKTFKTKRLREIGQMINHWVVRPAGTEGYAKAEVTLGGVDTSGLSSKTMESHEVRGLYFIGEVVDVTGWLGGYNFQWAWSSGFAAGQFV